MAHSFSTSETTSLTPSNPTRRRVLVTGAAGRIGSYFAEHSHPKYDLRLMVQHLDDDSRAIESFGEVVAADLGEFGGSQKHLPGS